MEKIKLVSIASLIVLFSLLAPVLAHTNEEEYAHHYRMMRGVGSMMYRTY